MKRKIIAGIIAALLSVNLGAEVYDSTAPNSGTISPRPECVPSNFGGSGTELKMVWSAEYGHAFGWWCVINTDIKLIGVFNPHQWKPKMPKDPAPTGAEFFYNWWDLNVRVWESLNINPADIAARDILSAEFITMMAQYKPTLCPIQPSSESITVQCPSGYTGNWIQSRNYISVAPPTCWSPTEWLPTTAPTGACILIPPVETWVVAKASSTASPPGTRPYYSYTPPNSVGSSILGRVTEGSPCDCNLAKAVLSSTYCSINGLANRVAVCIKK